MSNISAQNKIPPFNLHNFKKEAATYTTKANMPWLGGKEVKIQNNISFVNRYINQIDKHVGFAFGEQLVSIVGGIFGSKTESVEDFKSCSKFLEQRQIDSMESITSLVLDLHARLSRLGKIMLSQPEGISGHEFRQLKRAFAVETDGAKRHDLLMKFMLNKGFSKETLLPSFIRSIAQENVREMNPGTAINIVKLEVEKFNLFRIMAAREGKQLGYVKVDSYNNTKQLIEAIIEAGYPLELLSTQALKALEGKKEGYLGPNAQEKLQDEVDILHRMSRDLGYFLSGKKVEYINLKNFVRGKVGFATGHEYESTTEFFVQEFKDELKKKGWMNLAVHTKGKMQFFAPTPSVNFNIDAEGGKNIGLGLTTWNHMVDPKDPYSDTYGRSPSNADALKMMGGYMTAYFLMSEFIEKMDVKNQLAQAVQAALPAPIEEAPLPDPINDETQEALPAPLAEVDLGGDMAALVRGRVGDIVGKMADFNLGRDQLKQSGHGTVPHTFPADSQEGTKAPNAPQAPVAPPAPAFNPNLNVVAPKSSGNDRGGLLSSIQKGTQLKHVDRVPAKNKNENANDAFSMLSKAMEARRVRIEDNDTEDESSDSDWE